MKINILSVFLRTWSIKQNTLLPHVYPNYYKKNLVIKVLKCIFWVSNFNVCPCFEMYFLREQFWDVFFEGAILMLWSIFFEGAILKCIFWGSNLFRIYGCWLVWLVADLLDSFILSKRFKLRTEPGKKW